MKCIEEAHRENYLKIAPGIVPCLLAHEKIHFDQAEDCPPNGLCRPQLVPPFGKVRGRSKGECIATKDTIACLIGASKECEKKQGKQKSDCADLYNLLIKVLVDFCKRMCPENDKECGKGKRVPM